MMIHVLIRGRNCENYIRDCLASVAIQSRPWKALVIFDFPHDRSISVAKRAIKDLRVEDQVVFEYRRVRYGLGRNMFEGMNKIRKNLNPSPEDIIAVLDADDSLEPRAFNTVENVYLTYPDTLVTHGSYIKKSKKRKTKISRPYPNRVVFRRHPWRGSHLKTFKWKLWPHVPKEYFRHNGVWVEAASDLALMFCLMELAGRDRVRHVKEPIYIWRDSYHGSTPSREQKRWDRIIRDKTPLTRLSDAQLNIGACEWLK